MTAPAPGAWVWDDDAPGDVVVVRAADPGPSVPVEAVRALADRLRASAGVGDGYGVAMLDAADLLEALLP